MSSTTSITARLLPGLVTIVVLAACGSPPRALPTAPPTPSASGSAFASGPPAGVPATPGAAGGLPTPVVPPAGLPTYPTPTLPTTILPTTTPPTATPSPTPSPAGRCTGGPTRQQVLDVIKGRPGIPANETLQVTEGPYCARTWQFTVVGIVGQDPDAVEPLLVVTNGRSSALTLIEAGTDVCTDRVQGEAPPGIRVRACGM